MRFNKPYDQYDCFNIRDFRVNDSIMFKSRNQKIRAVITGVDRQSNILTYKTADGQNVSSNIEAIVFLDDYDPSWLTPFEN